MSPAARKTGDRKSVRLFVRSLIALLVAVALGPVATAEAQIEAPPGGPVLVADLGDGFTDFYGEILRAEGLNEFDVRPLTAQSLAGRQVVILAAGNPSAAQVLLLDDWVRKGGNLIAMRARRAGRAARAGKRWRRPGQRLSASECRPGGDGGHDAVPWHCGPLDARRRDGDRDAVTRTRDSATRTRP